MHVSLNIFTLFLFHIEGSLSKAKVAHSFFSTQRTMYGNKAVQWLWGQDGSAQTLLASTEAGIWCEYTDLPDVK